MNAQDHIYLKAGEPYIQSNIIIQAGGNMNDLPFKTINYANIPIITLTPNGQILLLNSPAFLVLGIFLVILGLSMIWLWMPKV